MKNQLFNEDSYLRLIKILKSSADPDARDDLSLVQDILISFHRYVDAVVRGEQGLSAIDNSDGTVWRDAVSQYDQSRHSAHELAIQNARLINRLADNYKVDPVYLGDLDQRHQVADFCLEADQFFFRNRRMKLS
ncbi:MAG: DUF3232 domain-containing protein [Clostridia bacterium]|nr:DUF3232 domain-containing protein [Clostridia bacterium]